MCLSINAHLAFAHGFQQRALGSRWCAIDFIGEYHVGEDRSAIEYEFSTARIVNAAAHNIARQQVRRKLQPGKVARNTFG